MMKLIVVACVIVAVIGVASGQIDDDEERKSPDYTCPLHQKPYGGGPGWNPPNKCATDCEKRGEHACCCKDCPVKTYSNGDTDCYCCPTSVSCPDNLNQPADRCTNMNRALF